MKDLVFFFLTAPLVVGGCAGGGAEPSSPLTTADFAVGGVDEDADSAEVREVLGNPDSVVIHEHPFDVGGEIPTHFYDDLIVTYGRSGTPVGFMLTGPAVETPRGLKVGDTVERVRDLYGEPDFANDEVFQYEDPDDLSGLHVIQVQIGESRVRLIFAGWLLD